MTALKKPRRARPDTCQKALAALGDLSLWPELTSRVRKSRLRAVAAQQERVQAVEDALAVSQRHGIYR
ncbi:hypothetical protein [Spongiibacter tropicus]|uniref:hypothetical protein n=1 Tax=Spongiibacter tropicus TaxID=454602 RepID=UPI0003B4D9E7|nr:hypothetical protein [Spongiibacter tropicus]